MDSKKKLSVELTLEQRELLLSHHSVAEKSLDIGFHLASELARQVALNQISEAEARAQAKTLGGVLADTHEMMIQAELSLLRLAGR